jgi:hypothetical protein
MSEIKYPIYIISKGRYESRLTSKSLEEMNLPYKIVVEPSEFNDYSMVIHQDKIIVCPEDFSKQGLGSIPVRNFVWEHSINGGHKRHWLLDDNISGFERLNKNQRIKVLCDSIFVAAENFVDRYENIAFAGFEYRQFGGGARRKKPPYKLNYRVYSTTLIKNDLPYRWRGKYNEDTDICLRALKDGFVTLTFNCFLQNKVSTMVMSGGNTDEIYSNTNNRYEFAESLAKQHPDCVKIVSRYGRYHHEVDYSGFKTNKLIKKEGLLISDSINEYGMKLITYQDYIDNYQSIL